MRLSKYMTFLAALGLLFWPGAGLGQTGNGAPLPVMLDIRDATTPPVPERIPKPFVPGAVKQKPKKPKKPKTPAKPKTQAAISEKPKPATPQSLVKQDAGLPQAPPEHPFGAPEGAPPLVNAPAEKISPIVPYVDDAPQAADQTANQNDYKPASPDASPELGTSPSQAGSTPEADVAAAAAAGAAVGASMAGAPQAAPAPQPTQEPAPAAAQPQPAQAQTPSAAQKSQ